MLEPSNSLVSREKVSCVIVFGLCCVVAGSVGGTGLELAPDRQGRGEV